MKQSRIASLIESVVNVVAGFAISLAAQAFFLPLLGVEISFRQNLVFAVIMTVISIGRSFVLRRLFEALHIRRPLSPFMQAAISERFRQIEGEGWSFEHDDKHPAGELANAGACYLMHAGSASPAMPPQWRWERDWWKPGGYRRDLVRGVALAIAEGERFDRLRSRRPRGGWNAALDERLQ